MDFDIIEGEILACAGLCVNDFSNAKKDILLVNVNNAELFTNLLNFGARICALNSSVNRDRFASGVEFYDLAINLAVQKFDLIIDLQNKSAEHYQKLLKNNGILIVDLVHLERENITQKGLSCNIIMPMRIQDNGQIKYYLFASNKFHPIADFSLQKLDMAENLRYCNAKIYEAVFAMPNYIKDDLRGIAQN